MHISTFTTTQSDNARAMSELCRIVYKFGHVHRSVTVISVLSRIAKHALLGSN